MPFAALSIVYRVAYRAARFYWFICRPYTSGVCCLIECDERFLFIRQIYGDRSWTIPEGGIKKHEVPAEAIQREVKEEVGVSLSELRCLGQFVNTEQYKVDTVYCYFSSVKESTVIIDHIEVKEAGWFILSNLPERCSYNLKKALELYLSTE